MPSTAARGSIAQERERAGARAALVAGIALAALCALALLALRNAAKPRPPEPPRGRPAGRAPASPADGMFPSEGEKARPAEPVVAATDWTIIGRVVQGSGRGAGTTASSAGRGGETAGAGIAAGEDDEAVPLEGTTARVIVFSDGWGLNSVEGASTVTGPDGRFELSSPPGYVELRIEEASSASLDLQLELQSRPGAEGRRRDLGDLPLAARTALLVRVVGPSDEPVRGATVHLGCEPPPDLRRLEAIGLRRITARAAEEVGDGEYLFESLFGGPWGGWVEATGYASEWLETVELPRDEPLVVRLVEGRRIAGSVRTGDGAPIAGAKVTIETDGACGAPPTTTDAAGRFLFDSLCDFDTYRFVAEAEGFAAGSSVAEPGIDEVEIRLVPEATGAGRVSGRVISLKEGTPVSDARVYLEGPEGPDRSVLYQDTREDGLFDFRRVPPAAYRLWVLHDSFLRFDAQAPLEVRGGQTVADLVCALEIGLAVTVRVLDSRSGAPVAGAAVELQNRYGTSGEEGAVVLRGLNRGEWYAYVRARGYRPLEEKGTLEESTGEIVLRPERGASISGRVLDAGGSGVAGAKVSVRPSAAKLAKGEANALTDGRGRFLIEGLPGDPAHEIAATSSLHLPGFATVAASMGEDVRVDIVLPAGGSIRGRVVDERGRGIALAAVEAKREETAVPPGDPESARRSLEHGGGHRKVKTGPGGFYDVHGLVSGRYTVSVEADGWAPSAITGVEVTDGWTADAGDLVLGLGASVAGRVVDGAGNGVGRAELWLEHGQAGHVFTRADGSFRILGLSPGEVQVRVRRPGYAPVLRTLTAPAEGVTIVLPRRARISGVVRMRMGPRLPSGGDDASVEGPMTFSMGPPVARGPGDASVTAEPLEEEKAAFFHEDLHLSGSGCRHDGSFVIQVPPGKWVLRASANGFGAADSEVIEVADGERREGIVIEIAPVGRIAGRVVGPSGEAVEGAAVSFKVSPGTRAVDMEIISPFGPSTEADGSFSFDLGEGIYDLTISHESEGAGTATRVAVRPGETTEVTIELKRG